MASLDPAKVPAGLVMFPRRYTMDDDPPQAEKDFGEDMKAFERQPVRSKELELLQHQAEKATGPEGVAIDAKIREKAKQGEPDPLPIA